MNRIKTAAAALVASAGLTLGAFAMASPAMADDNADYDCGSYGIINADYVGGIDSTFSFTADVSSIVPGDYPGLTGTADGASMSGDVWSGFVQFDGTTSGTSPSAAPSTVVIDNPTDPNAPIVCDKQ